MANPMMAALQQLAQQGGGAPQGGAPGGMPPGGAPGMMPPQQGPPGMGMPGGMMPPQFPPTGMQGAMPNPAYQMVGQAFQLLQQAMQFMDPSDPMADGIATAGSALGAALSGQQGSMQPRGPQMGGGMGQMPSGGPLAYSSEMPNVAPPASPNDRG